MKILHIHQDYPDGRPYPYTRAVSNLIDEIGNHDLSLKNVVLSINRTSNPFKISFCKFEQGYSLVFWALPLPFIYRLSLLFWAWFVAKKLSDVNFELVHAHKLTSEGILAYRLSKTFNKPFFLSIRGGTDLNNINRFKDSRTLYAKIYNKSKQIFWVSPWAKHEIQNRLGVVEKGLNFPNICNFSVSSGFKQDQDDKAFITVLSFHQYKRKGILPLLDAISELKKEGAFVKLNIVGSGPKSDEQIIVDKIGALDLKNQVNIVGQLPQSEVLKLLEESKGLLLPALNETFGMVYIESLAAGTPILYISNTGIDGYFESDVVGVRIKDQSIAEIKNGIAFLNENHLNIRQNLIVMTESGFLNQFLATDIVNIYSKEISRVKES